MHALLRPLGADCFLQVFAQAGSGADAAGGAAAVGAGGAPAIAELRRPAQATIACLTACAQRYQRALRAHDDDALPAIGRELFDWLNGNGCADAWLRGTGARVLEVRVDDGDSPLARALLEAPWELLASADGHLADDAVQLFLVSRRIGVLPTGVPQPLPAQRRDLRLLFMAAAPRQADELDFEAEEAAIAQAIEKVSAAARPQLIVEESGSAAGIARRLADEGGCEALHLSCHGDLDPQHGAYLALEDDYGDLLPASAGDLVDAIGDASQLPLLFLSACRTAESSERAPAERAGSHADGSGNAARAPMLAPLVRELIRAGVANVVGWDGSVADQDAIDFAQVFYGELARHRSTVYAAAKARQALRQQQRADAQRGGHWHLARLYLGRHGGGALTGAGLARAPSRHRAASAFLDSERGASPVAAPAAFVGRRRALQHALRELHNTQRAGVLLHGMGNLGKSSLAARIASRCTQQRTVVVFEHYDALAIFDRLLAALPGEQRALWRDWRQRLAQPPQSAPEFADALAALLAAPFAAQPILLVIDDLERILETPLPTATTLAVQAAYRPLLLAIVTAFAHARADGNASALLLTSRYRCTLPDAGGRELAATLAVVPLQAMNEREREKQLAAAYRLHAAGRAATAGATAVPAALAARVLHVAAGNPGLQAILTRPLLAGENAALTAALAVIEHYHQHGEPPPQLAHLAHAGGETANAVAAFFQRMAFASYRQALADEQAQQLRACSAFRENLPLPLAALHAAGRALGVAAPERALARLLALGLADDWGEIDGDAHAAANALATPLLPTLRADEAARIASAALTPLAAAWRQADGQFAWNARACELTRLALTSDDCPAELLAAAADAAAHYLFRRQHDARSAYDDVVQPALARLGDAASSGLLIAAVDCAERLGEAAAQDGYLAQLTKSARNDFARGSALLRQAGRWQQRGAIDAAETAYREAAQAFDASGNERDAAIARGGIADMLQARGELDAALRIRREEQLPVFQRLGDVHERAVTMGRIADILFERAELDEALAMHEEYLRLAEALGDLVGIAHARYSRAQIRVARGDHERGALPEIADDLAQAYAISRQTRRGDAIGAIGMLFAQVLAITGWQSEALAVLDEAEESFAKLGWSGRVARVQELRSRIAGMAAR